MTRRKICGTCRKPITNERRSVALKLRSESGRSVNVSLHEWCVATLQGVIALQSRQTQCALSEALERGRQERVRLHWYPSDIRTLRQRLDLYQDELAARLGVTRQTVYNHERAGAPPWDTMGEQLNALDDEAIRRTGMTMADWRL